MPIEPVHILHVYFQLYWHLCPVSTCTPIGICTCTSSLGSGQVLNNCDCILERQLCSCASHSMSCTGLWLRPAEELSATQPSDMSCNWFTQVDRLCLCLLINWRLHKACTFRFFYDKAFFAQVQVQVSEWYIFTRQLQASWDWQLTFANGANIALQLCKFLELGWHWHVQIHSI